MPKSIALRKSDDMLKFLNTNSFKIRNQFGNFENLHWFVCSYEDHNYVCQ